MSHITRILEKCQISDTYYLNVPLAKMKNWNQNRISDDFNLILMIF